MSTPSPPPTGAWRGPWGPPRRSPVPDNLAPQPSGSGNLAPQRDVASTFLGPLPGGLLRSVEAAPAAWRQELLVGLMRWAVSPQGDLDEPAPRWVPGPIQPLSGLTPLSQARIRWDQEGCEVVTTLYPGGRQKFYQGGNLVCFNNGTHAGVDVDGSAWVCFAVPEGLELWRRKEQAFPPLVSWTRVASGLQVDASLVPGASSIALPRGPALAAARSGLVTVVVTSDQGVFSLDLDAATGGTQWRDVVVSPVADHGVSVYHHACLRDAADGSQHLVFAMSETGDPPVVIRYAHRPSRSDPWTLTPDPLSGPDTAGFPSLAVTEPDKPGPASGNLVVCWREPYNDSVTLSDQTWLVVGPGGSAAWSTSEVVIYDFPLTEPSTPVVNLIDPSACYGPDGRLVLATHPGLLVEQAWVAEAEETPSGSPPVGWLATTRLHSADWTKPEFLHASSSAGLTLLLWFASGADITGMRGLFAATGTPPARGTPVPGATLAGLDWYLERDDIAQVIERLDVVAELSGQLRSTGIAGEYWLDTSAPTPEDLTLSVTVGDDVILWRLGATGSTQQVWDSYRVLEVEPTRLRLAWAGATAAPNLTLVPYEDANGYAFQGPHVAFPGVVVDPSDRVHVFWFESRVPIDEILADASEPVRLCYRSGTLEPLVGPVTEEKIREVGLLASLTGDVLYTSLRDWPPEEPPRGLPPRRGPFD